MFMYLAIVMFVHMLRASCSFFRVLQSLCEHMLGKRRSICPRYLALIQIVDIIYRRALHQRRNRRGSNAWC